MKRSSIARGALICWLIFFKTLFSLAQDSAAYCKVYFMQSPFSDPRESGLEHFLYYNIFIDSNFVCAVKAHKYFIHTVPAGKHSFIVQLKSSILKKRSGEITVTTIVIAP